MLTFSGYEKIADSVAAWGLDPASYRALRRVRWAVTEKIRAANFCFVVARGEKVRGANRRRLLTDDEPFFGWQAVRETFADNLRQVAARFPDAETVNVYAELAIALLKNGRTLKRSGGSVDAVHSDRKSVV